jgi:hypothetical protein
MWKALNAHKDIGFGKPPSNLIRKLEIPLRVLLPPPPLAPRTKYFPDYVIPVKRNENPQNECNLQLHVKHFCGTDHELKHYILD